MKKMIYKILELITMVSVLGCSSPQESNEIKEVHDSSLIHISMEQFQKSDFKLGKISKASFQRSIQVNGSTHIPEKSKAAVSSFIGGTVSEMDLVEGQRVNRGQILFILKNPELINWQEDYLVLKNELSFQQSEYERQKFLSEENINAKKTLKRAETLLFSTKARLGAITQKLLMVGIKVDNIVPENLTEAIDVYSPSSGYISKISVRNGTFLEPFKTAIDISNTNHIHIELSVLEKDIPYIKKGQKVKYTLQQEPDKKYEATVHIIEKQVSTNRTVNVHCHLDGKEKNALIPGMFVEAEILLAESMGNALPESTVITLDEDHFVLKHLPGSNYDFDQLRVKVGRKENGMVELLESESIDTLSTYLVSGAYYVIQ